MSALTYSELLRGCEESYGEFSKVMNERVAAAACTARFSICELLSIYTYLPAFGTLWMDLNSGRPTSLLSRNS